MDPEKLTKDSIVAVAIDLLNEEGLDGVSLRKLADRVGVKAPSLYWHFRDKDALLAAVVETIFDRCLDSIPPEREWKSWMRSFGMAVWRGQGRVKDFGRLVTTTQLSSEQLQRSTSRIRLKIRDIDLPEDKAVHIQASVQALITGWSAFAHAPYSKELSKTLDFEALVCSDLDALIAGKALQLTTPEALPKKRKQR